MKKIDILHFYGNSAGTAGLYTNAIFEILEKDFKQELIVNYHYPFKKSRRIIYKYSDISVKNNFKHDFSRKIVKFIELLFSLNYLLFFLIFNKVRLVNYNLTSDQFIEYVYLKVITTLKLTKVIITCHDVLPFNVKQINKSSLHRKKMFFNLDVLLLVHNDSSIANLKKHFNIEKNVYRHDFPTMDLSRISNSLSKSVAYDKFVVSMIGHFRREKGLEILIEAWKLFSHNKNNILLNVIGNFPSDVKYDFDGLDPTSFFVSNSYLSDNDYCVLIQKSNLVVLPYTRSTNSGIPSSVLSMGTFVICSDIPTFKENHLIPNDFLFENKNVMALVDKLNRIYYSTETEKKDWLLKINSNLVDRNNCVANSITQAYSDIFSNLK